MGLVLIENLGSFMGSTQAEKSAFLNSAAGDPVVLATSNHVCMMQWHSAGATGLVTRPYAVKHVIQLLDPGEKFSPAAVQTTP